MAEIKIRNLIEDEEITHSQVFKLNRRDEKYDAFVTAFFDGVKNSMTLEKHRLIAEGVEEGQILIDTDSIDKLQLETEGLE